MFSQYPLVSIGLPVYNAKPYLLDAIKSVLVQTYLNWELIIVDDGSTDCSIDFFKRTVNPKIKIFRFDKNMGLVYVLNFITTIAKGKYIARMDADDLMHPDRIKTQVEFLENCQDYDLVDTGAIIIDLQANPIGLYSNNTNSRNIVDGFKHGGFFHASILAKREWMARNPYDSSYLRAEDRELWARTLEVSRFGHIPGFFYYYRFVDNVRLRSYLQSYCTEVVVLKRYGFSRIGFFLTLYLVFRSYFKSAVLVFFFIIKQHNYLIRHSYESIKDDVFRNECNEIIKNIKSADIVKFFQ